MSKHGTDETLTHPLIVRANGYGFIPEGKSILGIHGCTHKHKFFTVTVRRIFLYLSFS